MGEEGNFLVSISTKYVNPALITVQISCIMHYLNVVVMSVPVTIESVGALKPDELFLEAVKVLKNKCRMILQQINNTNSQ